MATIVLLYVNYFKYSSYISECVLMMQLFLSNNNRDILFSSASKELENINQCNVPNKFYQILRKNDHIFIKQGQKCMLLVFPKLEINKYIIK